MNRTLKLSLLSFVAGGAASVGVFLGLRYLVAIIVHGGIW